jgi:hypothetical protein
MEPTYVKDDEDLYRAIRAGSAEYVIADGTLRFSASAFNDRECKPSVDRSAFRTQPCDARRSGDDGVTKVIARQVRSIRGIRTQPNREHDVTTYDVDAVHRPLAADSSGENANDAHCQIECRPGISATHGRKLKDALARLATGHGFVVKPGAEHSRTNRS